jgi:hypothetical protein
MCMTHMCMYGTPVQGPRMHETHVPVNSCVAGRCRACRLKYTLRGHKRLVQGGQECNAGKCN